MKLYSKSRLLLFLLIPFLFSCSKKSQDIIGHYYFKESKYLTYSLPNGKNSKKKLISIKKESFIDLFEDGTYILYLGRLQSGSYSIHGNEIRMKSDEGEEWAVDFTKDHNVNLGHFTFPDQYNLSEPFLTMNWMPHTYEVNYPFTKEWNQWRKVESSRLTQNELLDKVQNYIGFIKKYIIWCNKEKINVELIDVSGPLRFANNGFALRNRSKMGDWCSYFKEGDCLEMDYILRNHFDGLEIKWKKTNNKLMVLTDGLDQLVDGLNNYREKENSTN